MFGRNRADETSSSMALKQAGLLIEMLLHDVTIAVTTLGIGVPAANDRAFVGFSSLYLAWMVRAAWQALTLWPSGQVTAGIFIL